MNSLLGLQNISTGIEVKFNLIIVRDPAIVLYLLVGYFIRSNSRSILSVNYRPICLLFLFGVISLCISTLWCNLHGNSFELGLMFTTVVFGAIFLFAFIWYSCKKMTFGSKGKKLFEHIALYSYGIYCVHMPIMNILNLKQNIIPRTSGWALYIFLFVSAFVLSYLFVACSKRIPIFAKWVLLQK